MAFWSVKNSQFEDDNMDLLPFPDKQNMLTSSEDIWDKEIIKFPLEIISILNQILYF